MIIFHKPIDVLRVNIVYLAKIDMSIGGTFKAMELFKGYKLRELMEVRRLKQEDVAGLTGIHQTTISTWLDGTYNPRRSMINKLCQGLKIKDPEFFYRDDSKLAQIADLPPELDRFVAESDSIAYLIEAKKAKDRRLPPEIFDRFIDFLDSTGDLKK